MAVWLIIDHHHGHPLANKSFELADNLLYSKPLSLFKFIALFDFGESMLAPSLVDQYLQTLLRIVDAKSIQLDAVFGGVTKSILCQRNESIEQSDLLSPRHREKMVQFPAIQLSYDEHSYALRAISTTVLQCELGPQEHVQSNKRATKAHRTLSNFTFTFEFDGSIPSYLTNASNAVSPNYDKALLDFLMLVKATSDSILLVHQHELLTTDSLSTLQTRDAMRRQLAHHLLQGNVALCMVHCSDFASINKNFGHDAGDRVIKEVADIILHSTRDTDTLCRFGGALFGVGFQTDSVEEAMSFAKKIHRTLQEERYLDQALALNFDIGVAHDYAVNDSDSAGKSVALLIKHAEQALGCAQQSKQAKIVCWDEENFDIDEEQFQYFSGIFTPDNITNYRNMLLLWDISSIMADEYEFDKLFQQVVQRIASTIEFNFAGLIDVSDSPNIQRAFHISELADLSEITHEQVKQHDALIHMSQKISIEENVLESASDNVLSVVIGLGNDTKKCFFMVGEVSNLKLTHDTKMLLAGFVSQLGKAMRRSILEEALSKQLTKQNEALSSELETLKVGLQSSALVYRSDKMQRLMQDAQRAALTDTTVLITGESGTGKEKLIHALHSLGERSKQKLVIVDCGSIPETLIEAELFGHVKGAFTGAGAASSGKVKEADGGILVFDEIGELPLAMQPKLLRFVQEKYFTPVGSTKQLHVDVKIVAVTNRDLAFEVEAGTFRKDLYYRLNVVSLKNPPLRERSEDIPLLVEHFLTKFSHQFNLPSKVLNSQAMQAIQTFAWPGNIRELENTLMQAVLLSKTEHITLRDLNLDPIQNENIVQQPLLAQSNKQPTHSQITTFSHSEDTHVDIATPHTDYDLEEWKEIFKTRLLKVLDYIDNTAAVFDIPLGKCLELELIDLIRNNVADAKTGASRLSIPASTYRRKLLKLDLGLKQFENRLSLEAWPVVCDLLAKVAKQEVLLQKPIDEIQLLLTSILLSRYVGNLSRAALMLGVSEPTFYKMKKQVEQAQLQVVG